MLLFFAILVLIEVRIILRREFRVWRISDYFESLPKDLRKKLGIIILEKEVHDYLEFTDQVYLVFREHYPNVRGTILMEKTNKFIRNTKRIGLIQINKTKIGSYYLSHFAQLGRLSRKRKFFLLATLKKEFNVKNKNGLERIKLLIPTVEKIYQSFL